MKKIHMRRFKRTDTDGHTLIVCSYWNGENRLSTDMPERVTCKTCLSHTDFKVEAGKHHIHGFVKAEAPELVVTIEHFLTLM